MIEYVFNSGYSTFVDDKDYYILSSKTWYVFKHRYIRRDEGRKVLLLHRILVNCPDDKIVDHIDGNTFNNCKSNLRICNTKQNNFNKKPYKNSSSKYKGVSWAKHINKWVAAIEIDGVGKNLGSFNI